MNEQMGCLACLLRLVNHRNGLKKCFYAMSILVAVFTFLLIFGVIDLLKTIMGTSSAKSHNCKEVIKAELNLSLLAQQYII
jgi:hypothetical protein